MAFRRAVAKGATLHYISSHLRPISGCIYDRDAAGPLEVPNPLELRTQLKDYSYTGRVLKHSRRRGLRPRALWSMADLPTTTSQQHKSNAADLDAGSLRYAAV